MPIIVPQGEPRASNPEVDAPQVIVYIAHPSRWVCLPPLNESVR